jgi:nucleoside-diphosphate-sugar epimerase
LKKVLLTGCNGFLGKQICSFLISTGVEVTSLGRRKHNDIVADLACGNILIDDAYDTIIHLAGKAHLMPKTESQKQEFFNINVTGTANLLKGLENSFIPKAFIFISTVAVYGSDSGSLIKEETSLLASDAYGTSKIGSEKIVHDWCLENNVICTILRLPLIAGPNPPGNLGSMIKGIEKGYYFNISGGKAKKSMVLAEDVAKIIPIAANIGGIYNLTDGYHPSFSELSELIAKQLIKNKPINIPYWLAKFMAKIGDLIGPKAPINSDKLKKITLDLTFDDSKARELLGWNPTPVLTGFKIS